MHIEERHWCIIHGPARLLISYVETLQHGTLLAFRLFAFFVNRWRSCSTYTCRLPSFMVLSVLVRSVQLNRPNTIAFMRL